MLEHGNEEQYRETVRIIVVCTYCGYLNLQKIIMSVNIIKTSQVL